MRTQSLSQRLAAVRRIAVKQARSIWKVYMVAVRPTQYLLELIAMTKKITKMIKKLIMNMVMKKVMKKVPLILMIFVAVRMLTIPVVQSLTMSANLRRTTYVVKLEKQFVMENAKMLPGHVVELVR